MSSFPAANVYSYSVGQDWADIITALNDQLAATKQLVGANGEEALTIASGSVTPTRGTVKVDTQSAAATDDLDLIPATNLPDGSLLLLRATDAGRVVTVRHNQAGTGGINLSGGLNLELNQVDQWLMLQRRGSSGAYWFEVGRFGREKEHQVGGSGEPNFQNSWSGGTTTKFWKDETGRVHMRGFVAKSGVVPNLSVIFTLPAGYRPAATNTAFPAMMSDSLTLKFGGVNVGSNGEVSFYNVPAASSSGDVTLYLAGISFRAEA